MGWQKNTRNPNYSYFMRRKEFLFYLLYIYFALSYCNSICLGSDYPIVHIWIQYCLVIFYLKYFSRYMGMKMACLQNKKITGKQKCKEERGRR